MLNFYTTLRYVLFTGLFVTVVFCSQAQNRGADSLKNLLRSPNLTEREQVDLLNSLSYELYDVDDSAAFRAAQSALALAEKNRYLEGIKYAYTLIGLGHNATGAYREALRYFVLSDRVDAPEMPHIASYNQVLLGNTYRDLARYDSAEFYYNKAMDIVAETANNAYKARVHKNLAQLYLILFKNNEAIKHLQLAEELLRGPSPDVYQLADILSLYGQAYENLLDFNKAQIYFSRMCDVANDRNDSYHKIICVLNKADLASNRGEFAAALQYCFQALEMSKFYQYPPQMVEIYSKTGEVYTQLSQYPLASKYFFEALEISERLGLKYQTANILSGLSWIHKDQHNFPIALDYINRSQEIREEIGDMHGVSNSQNIRGLIYYQQKRYQEALREFDKSIEIRKAIGHEKGVSAGLFNRSLVFQDLGQYETTYKLQMQALSIDQRTDDKYNLSIDYTTLAELLVKMNRLDEAEQYMLQGYDLAKATQSKMLIRNSLRTFASFYEKKKDFAKAFRYQKEYQQVNDSIYSTDNSVKMAEMQALYQIEQKEQQIKLLSQERIIQEDQIKLQQSRISQQYLFIVLVSVALVLVTIVAYLSYRYGKQLRKAHREIFDQKEEIRVQSDELIEANRIIAEINKSLEQKIEDRTSALTQAYKELDTFFYRSSHDFRRPLTTFMGLAEVAKVTVKDRNALELFEKVKETAQNLDKMLIKLQSISDVGAQQLVYREVFPKDLFDSVCDSFRDELDQRNIKTTYEVHLPKPFISYPAMVKIIIENLVENAIHFCSRENPFIAMKVNCVDDNVIIEVRDNGEGIDPQYHSRIFEMYFRGNERSKGNGLGLYIVKKAVEKLHGTITFMSGIGSGSVFVVSLPRQTEQPSS